MSSFWEGFEKAAASMAQPGSFLRGMALKAKGGFTQTKIPKVPKPPQAPNMAKPPKSPGTISFGTQTTLT